jgi:hypothetical protein
MFPNQRVKVAIGFGVLGFSFSQTSLFSRDSLPASYHLPIRQQVKKHATAQSRLVDHWEGELKTKIGKHEYEWVRKEMKQ